MWRSSPGHIDKDITPTRWAALAKLYEGGPTSQNLLGRRTAMDGATIKGVVDRLMKLHLIETRADPGDGRRRVVALTESGPAGGGEIPGPRQRHHRKTLAPLTCRGAGAISWRCSAGWRNAARFAAAARSLRIFSAHFPHS